jgi:hypothetical protein
MHMFLRMRMPSFNFRCGVNLVHVANMSTICNRQMTNSSIVEM